MNDERLDRAIRAALGDVVATAPRRDDDPVRVEATPPAPSPRRQLVALAAVALTAAAGLVGVFTVTRSTSVDTGTATSPTAAVAPATAASTSTTPTASPSTSTASSVVAVPATYDAATLDAGYDSYVATGTTCGAGVEVPAGAANIQRIEGDVDGDEIADPVTLYLHNGDWHVHVVSSVRDQPSDTIVRVLVQRSMEISFEDLDYSLGAATRPPLVIMALGRGPNGDGITSNFTFLSFAPDYCVRQWQYHSGVFQWATVEEPGHITGMICETAAGTRYTTLVDAIQNDDGTWNLETQRLTHDFTVALLEQLPDETVADSAEFVARHRDLTGCTHPPLG
jgi:hypothetical protein